MSLVGRGGSYFKTESYGFAGVDAKSKLNDANDLL